MDSFKILFSNLGYARGIDGSLWHHVSRIGRHVYCPVPPQQFVLSQLKQIMLQEKPELCCFVEIDQGSLLSSNFNQMEALRDDDYCYHDISNKYGADSWLSRLPFHTSKSNGFLAKSAYQFRRLYFKAGRKRLIYQIILPGDIALYFAHFSLNAQTRREQFIEMIDHMKHDNTHSVLLADFNIFNGFPELDPLLKGTDMRIMNRDNEPTFRFHKKRHILDLALCSESLIGRVELKVIPQPYSDHAALFLKVNGEA